MFLYVLPNSCMFLGVCHREKLHCYTWILVRLAKCHILFQKKQPSYSSKISFILSSKWYFSCLHSLRKTKIIYLYLFLIWSNFVVSHLNYSRYNFWHITMTFSTDLNCLIYLFDCTSVCTGTFWNLPSIFQWKTFLLVTGDRDWMIFKVSCNKNQSMIRWKDNKDVQT